MTKSSDTMRAIGARGNRMMASRAQLRRGLSSRQIALIDVLDDTPDAAKGLLLIELLRMLPGVDRHRIVAIGELAFRDGINLTVKVADTPLQTRYWLVNRFPDGGRSGRYPNRTLPQRKAAA